MSRTFIQRGGKIESAGHEPPNGLSAAEWALERVRDQNPRIRTYLGLIRLLEDVSESDYAILHCSPSRLNELSGRVKDFAQTLRQRLAPALRSPSRVAALEAARENAEASLMVLGDTVLEDVQNIPASIPTQDLQLARKTLCRVIGQLRAFLHDTFGQIIAADPRSTQNADYFLSRRFPQEFDEAEWLHETVRQLLSYAQELDEKRIRSLSVAVHRMQDEHALPSEKEWTPVAEFLAELLNDFGARLTEVIAQRGIRLEEMQILNRHALDIPTQCLKILEIRELSCETLDAIVMAPEQESSDGRAEERCVEIFRGRLIQLMIELDHNLHDLIVFVPIWLHAIERRRALLLKRSGGAESHDDRD